MKNWKYRYASESICPHCGNNNCPIYKDNPAEVHDKHDVVECYRCGDLHRAEEGGTIELSPQTFSSPAHRAPICLRCDDNMRHW